MTTAEAIEGITDAGSFEVLAVRVLRLIDNDCRFLEHMGVNTIGKTVPNPIDSFCRVPETEPPRFVMAAFTTNKLDSLERKWLFDYLGDHLNKKATSEDDGDLVKANRRAEVLRKDHPGAKFIVYLCTNKQPDDRLLAKAIRRGQDFGIEVRFLTRSHLRDFLDVNPDGQWLRKKHLGIEAERLSLPLLCSLAAKSLEQYGREFLTAPDAFVSTSSERTLATSLVSPQSIYVVTASSGSGKSVACHQVLHRHLAQGGIGLWIPGEIVAHATSLEEAIGLTLHSLHPMMDGTAGADAIALGSPSQRLLIVVDDINRGGTPVESLRRLLAWSRPTYRERGVFSPSRVILVPVWDQFWAYFDKQLHSEGWLTRLSIDKMDENEAMACLDAALGPHARRLAEGDRGQIIRALERDPILIGLYAASTVGCEEPHPPAVAVDVIAQFVEMAEVEACNANSPGHLQGEYNQALIHLASRMLDQRDLYPRWQDVQQWLSENEVQAVRELARMGQLCRVTSRSADNHFEFRHDRILEHFLVLALQPRLRNAEANADVLSDPFYASFVGQAVTMTQPSDELLGWVRQHAPLALVSAIRFLPVLSYDMVHRIIDAVTDWLQSVSKEFRTPPAILWEAYRLLIEADTPHVLAITASLAHHPLMARARLANGDAAAAIVECSNTQIFLPAMNDRQLDAVLSRAIHRHKLRLIADLTRMLQMPDLTDSGRRGALVLAGFIADPMLVDPVQAAWSLTNNKQGLLVSALWAGIRCAASDPAGVLDGMMEIWAALPDQHERGGLSERMSISQELQFAVRRGITETVLRYLTVKARTDEALRWPITFVLEHVDHPIAVRFLIEEAAEIERCLKGTDKFSPWLVTLKNSWDPKIEGTGRRLPPEAVQEVRSCWETESATAHLRETAFSFWVTATDDMNELRSIPSDHRQFESVLWRRARLGDLSVAPSIKPLLATKQQWFHVLANIWTEQFVEVVDDALEKLEKDTPSDCTGGETNMHCMLAYLLRDIPRNQAQLLLLKHWDYLRFSRRFLQAALYLGSAECVAVADKAIAGYPNGIDPLQYIHYFFGFRCSGLMDRIELRHLEVLVPYLERLHDHALWEMADLCNQRNFCDWSLCYLKPEFDRRRSLSCQAVKHGQDITWLAPRYFPSDDDLLTELDGIEQRGGSYHGSLYHWSEEFERRRDEHTRWRRVLTDWLSRSPTVTRFRLVADAIRKHGTRDDIALLYGHVIPSDSDEIEQMIVNAKFGVMRRSLR
jgi:hypothetical protein